MDAVYIAAIAALFFVTVAFAIGCEKLGGRQ